MAEITATLKNARFIDIGGGRFVAGGNVYGDIRGRWPDGKTVFTSSVTDVQGDIVTTKNSTYKLEGLNNA